jgi:hypothetical protein
MVGLSLAIPHEAPPAVATSAQSAWSQAASLDLQWDVLARRTASEATTVRVASDGTFIYVRFDATQREPIAAVQRTDDVGQGNDDAVSVDLWSGSASGYFYQFQATPNGTHYQSSSENTAFSFTYHSGLQTNDGGNFPFHGYAATPTTISYTTGHYGTGRLDTWLRTSTIRAGARAFVAVALNNTSQTFRYALPNLQWFDSVSYTNQLNARSSLSLGVRRVVGNPPLPNGGGDCIGTCTNLSFVYRYRMLHSELYAAYGDPSTLTTAPQALVKLIYYAGADKGA